MADRAPSTFMSATPLSAWYVHAVPGAASGSVCSSTGWDLLADLQLEVQSRLSDTPLPTYDGSSVDGTNVPINDPTLPARAWDVDLLKALWAVAKDANAPQRYLDAIQQDATSGAQTVSDTTTRAGLWVGQRYYMGTVRGTGDTRYGYGSPDEVQLPAGTTLPSTVTPPPSRTERSAGAICNVQSVGALNLTPVSQSVVPFYANPWVILGVVGVAVGALLLLSKDVPIADREIRERVSTRRSRRRAA